jgi:hypothetical protein
VGKGKSITNLLESFGEVDMTLATEGAGRRIAKAVVQPHYNTGFDHQTCLLSLENGYLWNV